MVAARETSCGGLREARMAVRVSTSSGGEEGRSWNWVALRGEPRGVESWGGRVVSLTCWR